MASILLIDCFSCEIGHLHTIGSWQPGVLRKPLCFLAKLVLSRLTFDKGSYNMSIELEKSKESLERLGTYLSANMGNGWWPYKISQDPSIEATAWCAIACVGRERPESLVPAFLLSCQNADGGWSTAPGAGPSDWTSSLALIALSRLTGAGKPAELTHKDRSKRTTQALKELVPEPSIYQLSYDRGISFLLNHRAETYSPLLQIFLSILEELAHRQFPHGWSWNPGSYQWVEPTSYALLALSSSPRSKQGEGATVLSAGKKMLLTCACRGGGWNHGNKENFHVALPPYPVTTAQALLALQDNPSAPAVETALAYLQPAALAENTVMSLSWGIMALQAFEQDYKPHLDALLSKQLPDGSFGNTFLTSGLAGCALKAALGTNLLTGFTVTATADRDER